MHICHCRSSSSENSIAIEFGLHIKGEREKNGGPCRSVLMREMAEKDTTPFPPIDALMSLLQEDQRGTARSSKHFTASSMHATLLCHVLPAESLWRHHRSPHPLQIDSCRKRHQIKGLPRTHAARCWLSCAQQG